MEKSKKNIPAEIKIIILQMAVVLIIVIGIFALKFLGYSIFKDIRGWYIVNFCTDTNVNEVLLETNTDNNQGAISEEIKLQELPKTEAIQTVKLNYNSAGNSMCRPLKKYVISSRYANRINPITKKAESHKGIDLSSDEGSDILSVATGRVYAVRDSVTYGKYIIIEHGNGIKTLYAHCSKIYKEAGQSVIKGETIAAVGNTGQSTCPHLHFEVLVNEKNINPEWIITW